MPHTDPNGPADTRLMGLIHGALRRDLGRARTALADTPRAGARAAPGDRRAPRLDDAVPPRPPRDRGQRPLPDGGTRIEQAFRVVKAPKLVDRLYATMVPHHRDRDEALAGDLRRLGEVAAKAVAPLVGAAA